MNCLACGEPADGGTTLWARNRHASAGSQYRPVARVCGDCEDDLEERDAGGDAPERPNYGSPR